MPAHRSRAASPTKPSSPSRQLVVAAKTVSTAAVARAEGLLAEIARRKQRMAEDFYDIGVALRELLRKKLHVPLGFPSFGQMLTERGVMSATQAHKLIALVDTVPRAQAVVVGQEKAIALAQYARATPDIDTPERLLEEGRLSTGKLIAEASVRELKAATADVRRSTTATKKKTLPPETAAAEREARATQAWIRRLGARRALARATKHDGKWWVHIELPVEQSAAVRRAT